MERLCLSVKEAEAATGVSDTQLYRLMAAGQLAYRLIGRRRVIPMCAIRSLVGEES